MKHGLSLLSLGCLSACSAATPPAETNGAPIVAVPSATPTASAAAPADSSAPPARPRGPRTTRFDAKVNLDGLLQAGCVKTAEGLDCSQGGPVKALGCMPNSKVDDALGALTPAASIAECNTIARDPTNEGIVHLGCRLPVVRRYAVASGNKVELIKNADEFAARFGPVETPEEALAFAVALTKARPLAEVVIPEGATVYVQHIEPTYVEQAPEGYRVRLFDFQLCGCGPHDWLAVDFLVTRSGKVTQTGAQAIYADPKMKGMCVD